MAARTSDAPGKAALESQLRPAPRPFRPGWAGIAPAFVAAIVQLRLVLVIAGIMFDKAALAAEGVLSGRPHWRIYQSRLLGPLLVKGIALATSLTFLHAQMLFEFLMLWLAGWLAWCFACRIGGRDRRAALVGLLAFHGLFAALLAFGFLYAWDYVCAVVFLVFIDLVVEQRRAGWFVALFWVAVVNRESALFIAFWMIGDPIVTWLLSRRSGAVRERFRWPMALWGLACGAGGAVTIEVLRRKLLVQEVMKGTQWDKSSGPWRITQLQWFDNVESVKNSLKTFGTATLLNAELLCLLLLLLVMLALLAWRDPRRWLGLLFLHVSLITAELVFGIVYEPRVFIELVPALTLSMVALATPAPREHPGTS